MELTEKWPVLVRHEQAAQWLRIWTDLGRAPRTIDAYAPGLANATLQQRLSVTVRLFYDFLVEEGVRESNPVGRGRYTPGRHFGGESFWRPTALMDLMRSGSDGGPARKR
jgi:hypothetical protein